MGMATQLLFTTIITLMKVAILLTYLRKRSCIELLITYLQKQRHLSFAFEQMVLLHHAVLYGLVEYSLLLCHPLSMRVSIDTVSRR